MRNIQNAPPVCTYIFSGFKKLFCLLGMNQQGIGTSSLSIWVGNCDLLDINQEEREKLDTFIDKLYEDLDQGTKQCSYSYHAVSFRVRSCSLAVLTHIPHQPPARQKKYFRPF